MYKRYLIHIQEVLKKHIYSLRVTNIGMDEGRELRSILVQLLEGQRKIEQELLKIKQKTDQLDKRLSDLERGRGRTSHGLTPALVKVLARLNEVKGEVDIAQVAESLKISRNIANAYLNKLMELGYVYKLPNPDPTRKAKYLYALRNEKIDERLRDLLERVKR